MAEDGRIDYIKDSLDKLHDKVDRIYGDTDVRLKSLEESRSHQGGVMRTLGVVSALIGSTITLVSSYVIFKD